MIFTYYLRGFCEKTFHFLKITIVLTMVIIKNNTKNYFHYLLKNNDYHFRHSDAAAELTIALMLNLARHIPQPHSVLKQ